MLHDARAAADVRVVLLAFCNSFPAEYDWENSQDEWEDPYTRIISGKQMGRPRFGWRSW